MIDTVDCVVVGAGVVGLAVARALALQGREVMVLEAADAIGTGTSSRNSEVIHAGLYYPAGSLKARLCVRGQELLYAYCAERGVPHRRCGKLLVATSAAQLDSLEGIQARARANGVLDLQRLSREEALALEPALACVGALHSPSTGIVDSHALMLALQGDLEHAGGLVALNSPLALASIGSDAIDLEALDGTRLRARTVVNAAGLHAPALAARFAGLAPQHVPTAFYAKGNYFTLTGKAPFSRLIYPVPEAAGLGCTSRWTWADKPSLARTCNGWIRPTICRWTRARRCLLCRGAQILAWLARWRFGARLRGHAPQDPRAGCTCGRLHDPGPCCP